MFLYLLPYVYIFGFCIVSLQCINVSSGMYKLVSNNRHPTNPPAHMFLNLVILPRGKRFFKGIYVLRFALVSKRILIFLISVCFPFFTRLLNRRKVSIFYSSRLSFWLVLDNLSKKLINSSAFWCPCDIESTVYYSSSRSLKFKQNSSPHTHDHPVTWDLRKGF